MKNVGTTTALTITLATSNVSTLAYAGELETFISEGVVVEEVVTQEESTEVEKEVVEIVETTEEEVAEEIVTQEERTEVVEETVEIVETTEIIEIVEEIKEENTCYLSTEIECKIYNKAIENEMTHEQAILLVAISKHETGNWTSYNFKNKNNLGGLYNGKEGTFYSYETLEKGIEAFVNLLKNRYFGKGLNTIEEIGNVYCPVGAKNDPNGLNKNWIPKVSQYYNNYLGK